MIVIMIILAGRNDDDNGDDDDGDYIYNHHMIIALSMDWDIHFFLVPVSSEPNLHYNYDCCSEPWTSGKLHGD